MKLMIPVHQRTLVRNNLLIPRVATALVVFLSLGWSAVTAQDILPVYVIQGEGLVSPYWGARVTTFGVVTAVTPDGFYLQDPNGDGRDETSDGVFVYTSKPPSWPLGTCVDVRNAYVDEYYEKTELSRAKVAMRAAPCVWLSGQAPWLPVPQFGQDVRSTYERYEGMVVALDDWAGVVQGPTKRYRNGDAELSFVPTELVPYLSDGRIFQAEADEQTALVFVSGILGATLPDANWGDAVAVGRQQGENRRAAAVVDFNFGKYQVLLLPGTPVEHTAARVLADGVAPTGREDFTICTVNLLGLGQGSAQTPDAGDYAAALQQSARVIAQDLQGCTILGLQETGTPTDAAALADRLRSDFGLDYLALSFAGPQTTSSEFPLTNSVLVRRDRVQVLAAQSRQGCSAVDYAVDEDRNVCPAGQFPLFDRPPLLADLLVTGAWDEPYALRVIDNHWKSKTGDELANAPRRVAQARFVAAAVQERLVVDSNAAVVVLGDLNDYADSESVATLRLATQPALVHTFDAMPPLDRYTYIYNGSSQILDHILVSASMAPAVVEVNPVHINADFAAPLAPSADRLHHTSDHDPVLVRIRPGGGAWMGGNLRYAGVRVEAIDAAGHLHSAAVTDAMGEFRLWNLTPGALRLRMTAPPYVTLASAVLDIVVAPGENRLVAAAPVHTAVRIGVAAALDIVQLGNP